MRFLPFETIIIETPLSKEETIANLVKNMEPEKTLRFRNKPETKAFEGHLIGSEFEIKRVINYRNSFLPVIKGRIETFGNVTRVTMGMRLHAAVIVLMTIWFGFVGLFFIESLAGSRNSDETFIFPLGMLIFGYVLSMGGYLFEAYRAKEILTDIIKGRIISNAR